jgi:hypothetical protein
MKLGADLAIFAQFHSVLGSQMFTQVDRRARAPVVTGLFKCVGNRRPTPPARVYHYHRWGTKCVHWYRVTLSCAYLAVQITNCLHKSPAVPVRRQYCPRAYLPAHHPHPPHPGTPPGTVPPIRVRARSLYRPTNILPGRVVFCGCACGSVVTCMKHQHHATINTGGPSIQ